MIFALMIIASGIFAPDPWKSYILKVATYKVMDHGGNYSSGVFL